MSRSTQIQNILLGLLALAAAAAVAAAVWPVRADPASSTGELPPLTGVGTSSSTAGGPDDAALTSDGAAATGSAADDAALTSEEPVAVLDAWNEAVARDGANLLVVGDGYSHLPEQWVQLWGALRGDDRPVSIRHWGEAEDRTFNDPIVLSEGEGSSLAIWSASRAESTIAAAVERLERFDRASADPVAVVVSLGQASGGENAAEQLDALLAGLPEVPVVLVVGPEGLYDDGVGDAFAEWAQDHEDRIALVDLRGTAPAGASAQDWADAFESALTEDEG